MEKGQGVEFSRKEMLGPSDALSEPSAGNTLYSTSVSIDCFRLAKIDLSREIPFVPPRPNMDPAFSLISNWYRYWISLKPQVLLIETRDRRVEW